VTGDRTRKLRATYAAVTILFAGLVACLVTVVKAPAAGVAVVVGLFSPFAVAVSGVMTAFVVGNVKVHQAQAEPPAKPGGTP
jgi:hypothetical protein